MDPLMLCLLDMLAYSHIHSLRTMILHQFLSLKYHYPIVDCHRENGKWQRKKGNKKVKIEWQKFAKTLFKWVLCDERPTPLSPTQNEVSKCWLAFRQLHCQQFKYVLTISYSVTHPIQNSHIQIETYQKGIPADPKQYPYAVLWMRSANENTFKENWNRNMTESEWS